MQLFLDLNFAWAGGSKQKHLDDCHIFPCLRKVTSFAHATHEKTKTFFLSGLAIIAQTHGPLYKMLKNKLHRCTAAVSPMAALAGLSREQGHTSHTNPNHEGGDTKHNEARQRAVLCYVSSPSCLEEKNNYE